MPFISEAIKKFLDINTYADLAVLYNKNMEVQVQVAKDDGERIESDFKGRGSSSYSNGVNTWYPIRIPKNANKEPEDNDKEINYDIAKYALGIGCTGWNWVDKVSQWVGFDFDAISGHSDRHNKKLTDTELLQIEKAVENIDWVTIRRSTSGNGRHLYIFTPNVPTQTHSEHAALARSILGLMSALAGFDFQAKVDACGHILWQWHRKMKGTNGLELIKTGSILHDIPNNWKDHIPVIKGTKKKTVPTFVEGEETFTELTGQRARTDIDDEHRRIINYLQEHGHCCEYNQDHHILITHTHALKQCHSDLGLKGVFDTLAEGSQLGDKNAFCFFQRDGVLCVKRYTLGIQEATTWEQDQNGYTTCFFNRVPDLRVAARTYGGIEDIKGGFSFNSVEEAQSAALMLGTDLKLPAWALHKKTILRRHKDGRLIAFIDSDERDGPKGGLQGWIPEGKRQYKLFATKLQEPNEAEVGNFDDIIRHLVSPTGDNAGWTIKVNTYWQNEPILHVIKVLKSMDYKSGEADIILGNSICKSWRLVNKPFQPEFPGNREWNRHAAQFRFAPSENKDKLHYPTWLKLLKHIGKSLDDGIKLNEWAKTNNILTGADYIKCWIASVFQYPTERLPYLFLYGPENSGKSSLHEALNLLVTDGIKRADNALTSQGNFNAELQNAIVCVIEETDMRKDRRALNKIKDWITSSTISIHSKGSDPYDIINTTHFIQASNSFEACPVFPGDTRITVLYVDSLEELIPKRQFMQLLEKEAQDFITEIMNLEIPDSGDRLNVPVIITDQKMYIQNHNMSELESFIKEKIFFIEGQCIKFSDFYDHFIEYIDPNDAHAWSKIKVGRDLPPHMPKGRRMDENANFYVGNVSFVNDAKQNGKKWMLKGDNLVLIEKRE